MSESGTAEDALAGWDPRRRASLERLWARFREAAGEGVSLSDEVVAERHVDASRTNRADAPDDVGTEHRPGHPFAGRRDT